jgi:hypothetical protein
MNKYEQLIEAIISEDEAQAKELFHQIVVEKSRDIYESLMDEESTDVDSDTEELADDVEADEVSEEFDITAEEAKSLMDYVDSGLTEGVDAELLERVAQYFGVSVQEGLLSKLEESSDQLLDIAYGAPVAEEGEEEMSDMDMDMPADEMDGEHDYNNDGKEDEHEEDHGDMEDRVMDLESALDDLKAEFDALMADEAEEEAEEAGEEEAEEAGEEAEEAEEEGEEEEMAEAPKASATNDLDIMREYVEKVSAPSNQEGADNKESTVAGKNDMGGTAKNTAQGGEEAGRAAPKAAAMATGNKNVPGGKQGLEKA